MKSRRKLPPSPLQAMHEVYDEAKAVVNGQVLKEGDIPVLMFTKLKDKGWRLTRMSAVEQQAWLDKWKGK